MQILYDGQIYKMQIAGGINRYFANIIGRLPEDFAPFLIVEQGREVNFPFHRNLRMYNYGRMPLEHISWKLAKLCSVLEKRYHESLVRSRRFHVIHPTYYSLLTGQQLAKCRAPIVINVWDMINELFAAEYDPDGSIAELKQKAISASQAVICISENTKKDLIEHYKVPESKVVVTHLASELDISMTYGPEPVPSRPYYLFVGSRFRYKNFDGLLKAFAKINTRRTDLGLCVVGAPFVEEEEKLLSELKLSDRVERYGIPNDSHLAKLYRSSIAFIYPSLYEGFGLPPLEAMSCGTAVVASDRSSIPEVVGDGGILFNPESEDDLADILLLLSSDSTKRDELVKKGLERSKAFDWDKTLAETLAVYRTIQN
jgi:glycosyltransferase involved in cell wall biosynthesis